MKIEWSLAYPEIFLTISICLLVVYGVLWYSKKGNILDNSAQSADDVYKIGERQNFIVSERNISGAYTVLRNITYLGIFTLLITFLLLPETGGKTHMLFTKMFVIDDLAVFVKGVVILSTIVVLYMNKTYIRGELYNLRFKNIDERGANVNGSVANSVAGSNFLVWEVVLLILLAVLGILLLISSNDLLALYLAIELQSLCLYVLAALKRTSEYSVEAGLKYFVLGAFSSGFLLFGCALIYAYAGTTNFEKLMLINSSGMLLESNNYVIAGLITGIAFITIALLFKLAAVPFHMWAPDVYEGAPTIVTAFFAIVPKIAIFSVLIRLFYNIFYDILFLLPNSIDKTMLVSNTSDISLINESSVMVLSICAMLSMLVGTLGALAQKKIKRLLAYSAISHAGYMLMGFATGTIEGIEALLIYIMIYIIITIATFSMVIALKKVVYITDLDLLNQTNPVLAITFAIFIFSTAGIPPLAGFFSKLYLFLAAISASMYPLVIVALISSCIGCFYYIRLIKLVFFSERVKTVNIIREQVLESTNTKVALISPSKESLYHKIRFSFFALDKEISILLSVCTFFMVFFILYPNPLFVIAHKITLSIFL
jgi:NADH-quinone oxidoreductase subunit N